MRSGASVLCFWAVACESLQREWRVFAGRGCEPPAAISLYLILRRLPGLGFVCSGWDQWGLLREVLLGWSAQRHQASTRGGSGLTKGVCSVWIQCRLPYVLTHG